MFVGFPAPAPTSAWPGLIWAAHFLCVCLFRARPFRKTSFLLQYPPLTHSIVFVSFLCSAANPFYFYALSAYRLPSPNRHHTHTALPTPPTWRDLRWTSPLTHQPQDLRPSFHAVADSRTPSALITSLLACFPLPLAARLPVTFTLACAKTPLASPNRAECKDESAVSGQRLVSRSPCSNPGAFIYPR
jgi:hypothetical protein